MRPAQFFPNGGLGFMSIRLFKLAVCTALAVAMTTVAWGQDTKVVTKKEIVTHPDGSYTVIEYPVGKEVTVNLLPSPTLTGGKGVARVIRSADGTKVYLDVSGVPATTASYYAYAVDPSGATTLLGPLAFVNGVAKAEFSTPMNQFMLVLSPMEGLTAVDPTTTIVFHSEVPKGYAVVPKRTSESRVLGVQYNAAAAAYQVPMLGISTFGNKEREVKMKFGGELEGLEGKAYITPKAGGATKVRMHFDDMKKVPANKRFVLWTVSPDGQYTKLGQIIHTGGRDEAEIKSETSLNDFGLFITAEDADVTTPTSKVYSVFSVVNP